MIGLIVGLLGLILLAVGVWWLVTGSIIGGVILIFVGLIILAWGGRPYYDNRL